jgi:hypothetical protein
MELLEAVRVCREGRGSLARARRQFVNSSLGILAGCRRRKGSSPENPLKNQLIVDAMIPSVERYILLVVVHKRSITVLNLA